MGFFTKTPKTEETTMLASKWQWMDNHFGPMGWFNDADKQQHEGTPGFLNGHWRPIASENRALAQLAYEQS